MIIRDATLEDANGIANVHVSSWQTTYKGLMPDEAIAARSVEQRQAMWERILSDETRQSILLLAIDNGEIVGFANGGQAQTPVDGFDAELYAIYLLKDAQGKGLGRTLMHKFAKKAHDSGYKNLILSVLKENKNSRGFYEKMGGVLVGEGEYQITEKIILKTITYAWKDIRTLLVEGK